MTDYFFAIIYLGTTSFGNEPLFTQQKENCGLIKCFGPMFIDFDEYPHYSGRESIIFEKYVNEDTWERMKNCFTDATKIYMN